MAQIDLDDFEQIQKERNHVQEAVPCTYCVFEDQGTKYLQIDMYGRQGADRKFKSKVTQVIQFDRESARQLVKLFLDNGIL